MSRRDLVALFVALGCTDGRSTLGTPGARLTDPVRDAVSCSGRTISNDAVGAIHLGMTVGELGAVCNVVRDSIELRTEGYPVRVMVVLVGRDTVNALIDDSVHVTGIEVVNQGFATNDSLMVGTTLGRLLQYRGALVENEGGIDVARLPTMCGLGFKVGYTYVDFPAVATVDTLAPSAIPPRRPVLEIDISPCS